MLREPRRTSVFTRRALLVMGAQVATLGVLAGRLYQVQVVEGKKGCGEAYYQEDVPKSADGQVPYEINCGNCGALLRAFANLDNLRS